MEDMQVLERNAASNAALQDIDDILRTNCLDCRSICLPLSKSPMFIKPVNSVNKTPGCVSVSKKIKAGCIKIIFIVN